MNAGAEEHLRLGRNELRAARHLLEGGFLTQATSSANYAAFHAATAALGEGRCTLRVLFGKRGQADYETREASTEEAEQAVAQAEAFVEAVEEWIAARG